MDKKNYKQHAGIQGKFLFGLAAILVFFSGLVSVALYVYQKDALENEALRRATLIMTAVDASRSYVREVLRPTMYGMIGEDDFILEAMSSSYISRAIMERVNHEVDDFSYRRVSINARNPDYEAVGMEKEMIAYFSNNKEVKEWHKIVEKANGERVFMKFKPVVFGDSCLHCHGHPEDAPQKILDNYGEILGFNRNSGEIAGVISVGLPVDINLLKIKELVFIVFAAVIPSTLILYIIISLFFNKLVVQNLRLLLTAFRTNLRDDHGMELLEKSQTLDEIEELTGAAATIADHLEKNKDRVEKYAAEVLRNKDLLQSVFDGITDPVVLINKRDKTIKTVNKAFILRYDSSFDEVLGHDICSLPMKESCPICHSTESIDLISDQPVEREVHLQDGSIFLIYFYPVNDEGQELSDIVCYVKEITQQKKLEQQIQQTEKLVSIGQLAAGVAHEINNPLGVILCHLDLIKEEANLTTQAREDLKIIDKHITNCRNIISDLLRFARQSNPTLTKASINDLIRKVVAMASNQLEMQAIRINLSLDETLPPVPLDIDRVRQVLLNMLLNGAQAIEKDGLIQFSSRQEDDRVIIEVEDNGVGIAKEFHDKIFDPFFTTKPPGKGTGLGLSVSFSIIKEHGGTIAIESDPKENFTRFTISLPVEEEKDV